MSGTLTLHLDESGTPLTGVQGDGLFVVGGFALFGDPEPVASAADENLPRYKGNKFSKAEFLDLATFLAVRGIVPIASHCRLNDADWEAARLKARALEKRLRGSQGEEHVTPAAYLWPLQVAHTVVVAVFDSLPRIFGEISRVEVFVDQFQLPSWFRGRLQAHLREWFQPGSRSRGMLDQLEQFGYVENFRTVREKVRTKESDVVIHLKSGGGLHRLADGVAAMYRRKLKREEGADAAWHVLEVRYQSDGVRPACVGMDLTRAVRESLATPV